MTGQHKLDRGERGNDMQQRVADQSPTHDCCGEDRVSVHGVPAPPGELPRRPLTEKHLNANEKIRQKLSYTCTHTHMNKHTHTQTYTQHTDIHTHTDRHTQTERRKEGKNRLTNVRRKNLETAEKKLSIKAKNLYKQ